MSFIQFPPPQLTSTFVKKCVSSTVTLIAGKKIKYIHQCMLICVEMDFNLVQVLTFVLNSLCIFIKLFLHSFHVYIVLCTKLICL